MSGGTFDYTQYHIGTIADRIESELRKQGKEKEKDDLWFDPTHYEKYPEERYYYTYPEHIQKEMRNAIKILRKAAVYAQRIDWFLAGDDGEETFIERLTEDLKKLEE